MENQLQVIVQESGIEETKGKYLLDRFTDYFNIAAEWESKAKTLIVTNEDQKAEMKMARTGRLFLREKRIAVERARKELKEQALREGKAIDGIANVLKALIIPIEEHLEKQEKFIEIQEENKQKALQLEAEKRIEEERIAKEKADAEEAERIRVENERLKKEAAEREKRLAAERKAHDDILAKERNEADAESKRMEVEARKEREMAEKKLQKEREQAAREREEEKLKVEVEKKKADEKAQARVAAERKEKERLTELLKNQVECPKCHHKFPLIKKGE